VLIKVIKNLQEIFENYGFENINFEHTINGLLSVNLTYITNKKLFKNTGTMVICVQCDIYFKYLWYFRDKLSYNYVIFDNTIYSEENENYINLVENKSYSRARFWIEPLYVSYIEKRELKHKLQDKPPSVILEQDPPNPGPVLQIQSVPQIQNETDNNINIMDELPFLNIDITKEYSNNYSNINTIYDLEEYVDFDIINENEPLLPPTRSSYRSNLNERCVIC
jgi:hypothetical protein